MTSKEELKVLRDNIDAIDDKMLALFNERMGISSQVAAVKARSNLAVTDLSREEQVIANAITKADQATPQETTAFMNTLMALSKSKQSHILLPVGGGADIPKSANVPSGNITVAYQGVAGAWGEHSAMEMFPHAERINCDYFEDVVDAVKSGKAQYGVLPIENSQTGAIGEVYDLLRRHSCYIAGQAWINIAQCLLGIEGAGISDVREVFSHPEGFGQCRRFLKNKNWELTACRNTAYAAKLVADKAEKRYASIGSRRAAQAHGLTVLAPDIMDNAKNSTRFIAIAASPIYDENCDTTSITFSTAHKSGALCAVLQSFMLAGINLSRIESRPAGLDTYRFFADLQVNVMSDIAVSALNQAATHCDYFEVLGCYKSLA